MHLNFAVFVAVSKESSSVPVFKLFHQFIPALRHILATVCHLLQHSLVRYTYNRTHNVIVLYLGRHIIYVHVYVQLIMKCILL